MKRVKRRNDRAKSRNKKTILVRESLREAWQAYAAGKLRLAEQAVAEILREVPRHPETLHLSGRLQLSQGDPQAAVATLQTAVAVASDDVGVLTSLGRAYCESGDLSRGAEAFRSCVRLRPSAETLGNLATALAQSGELDEAIDALRKASAAAPDSVELLVNLGNALCERGDHNEAIEVYQNATRIRPDFAAAHYNLGNALWELERPGEAIQTFQKAIELRSDYQAARNGLGMALLATGDFEEAVHEHRQAAELAPQDAAAQYNLGLALCKAGQVDEGLDAYEEAIRLRPEYDAARESLGRTLHLMGLVEDAVQSYRDWLAQDPENPIARHMLAAATGEDVHERASDEYVERIFDRFAETFDRSLSNLQYRAPCLIVKAVERLGLLKDGDAHCLDAGCGTGLCGPALRPLVQRLDGVDLSSGMLDKARTRRVYDSLVQAELSEFAGSRSAEYQLIVSSDTLNYFGDLRGVLQNLRDALTEGGHLVFTLELAAGEDVPADGFRLDSHGRYAHGEAYLRESLDAVGFQLVSAEQVVLRQEAGEDVSGVLVVCRG